MTSIEFILSNIEKVLHVECIIEGDVKAYSVFFNDQATAEQYVKQFAVHKPNLVSTIIREIAYAASCGSSEFGVNVSYAYIGKFYYNTGKGTKTIGINIDINSGDIVETKTYLWVNDTITKFSDNYTKETYILDNLINGRVIDSGILDLNVLGYSSSKGRKYYMFSQFLLVKYTEQIKAFLSSSVCHY